MYIIPILIEMATLCDTILEGEWCEVKLYWLFISLKKQYMQILLMYRCILVHQRQYIDTSTHYIVATSV